MTSIRRLFAAVVLLGIVVGAPVALWVFGRNLLPDHVPSWLEVKAFFTERDSGQLFLGALVIIAIVAWLVFTISVLIESAAMLSGRRGQWRVPGLRIPQRAAGALLALLFTATITVGTAMPALAASGPATSLAAAVQNFRHPAAPAVSPAPADSTSRQAATPGGGGCRGGSVHSPDGADVDRRPLRHAVANRGSRPGRRVPLPGHRRPQ